MVIKTVLSSIYSETTPYKNIKTCILKKGIQPTLVFQYSNIPQKYYGKRKLVLAHKMYGFPYYDKTGLYGISNRDNYIFLYETEEAMNAWLAFFSTKVALYIFESTRYRMKYLEKQAFQFIPDIMKLEDFPLQNITDDAICSYFGLDEEERKAIQCLHKKKYKRCN